MKLATIARYEHESRQSGVQIKLKKVIHQGFLRISANRVRVLEIFRRLESICFIKVSDPIIQSINTHII